MEHFAAWKFEQEVEAAILKYICILPFSGNFKNIQSFHENELQDLIEDLILKVSKIQVTDLNKFNKSGFIFSDLVFLGEHMILSFIRK